MKTYPAKIDAAVKGFFYLDHSPTGKVYTGTADNMQQVITEIESSLVTKTCRNKRLKNLYDREPDFVARIFPTRTIKEARKLESSFRSERPEFLLLN